MAIAETILQHEIFTRFIFPFLLIFFIIFAILEKTKLFGDKKQLDALVAFVIGLIVIAVAYPVFVINNLILFLTVAIIIVFIVLLIWGFIMGGDSLKIFEKSSKALKWVIGIAVLFAVFIAVLWATGTGGGFADLLFNKSWSQTFWVNLIFIVVIAVVLAIVVRSKGKD